MKKNIQTTGIALGAIAVGVALRIGMKGLPNIEPITLIAVLGGAFFLRKEYAIIVPLAITVISDLIIGNTEIAIATWSAWAMIGAAMLLLQYTKKKKLFPLIAVAGGVGANIFFYLWTNFGVWLEGVLYPKTFDGLLQSYVMGLPFLKNQIIGNIVMIGVVTLGIVAVQTLIALKREQKGKVNLSIV